MVPLRSLGETLSVITGGSSGIGLSTAELLSSMGSRVVLIARDEEKLENAASTVDGVVGTYSVDISDWPSVESAASRIVREHGPPNILINSAGVVYPGRFADLDISLINRMIDIDLKGTIHICRAFIGSITDPGHIVNISSMAGVIGLYGYTGYSAAKFGIRGFSEALRMELEPRNIGVSVVFPPDTETPQLEFENRTKPPELQRISGTITPISAERVAKAILKGMTDNDFLIFPDISSKAAYHANRLAGPAVRSWMDNKVRKAPKEGTNEQ
ncbi:MAG: SDR family oxidoreductase [Thermoplasmatota archaeon]